MSTIAPRLPLTQPAQLSRLGRAVAVAKTIGEAGLRLGAALGLTLTGALPPTEAALAVFGEHPMTRARLIDAKYGSGRAAWKAAAAPEADSRSVG